MTCASTTLETSLPADEQDDFCPGDLVVIDLKRFRCRNVAIHVMVADGLWLTSGRSGVIELRRSNGSSSTAPVSIGRLCSDDVYIKFDGELIR
jgi:hypothetical protein